MQANISSRVLLSGASGMLGRAVAAALKQRGDTVLTLVRGEPRNAGEFHWDPEQEDRPISSVDLGQLEGVTAAVHFSGASVASKRWTAAYKDEIRSSRVVTTQTLARVLAGLTRPPVVMVSASAVGYYGDRGDEILDENSLVGTGFFPEVCQAWEDASVTAAEAGIRVVHPRFGVVLGKHGGALSQMKPLFRLGLGGKLGSGKQWMSWISEADAVGSVLFAMDHSRLVGAFNAVAPEAVTNAEFTRELGRAVHRPTLVTAPAFALRLAFGEMADEALLSSVRVRPGKLIENGYTFQFPTLAGALADALGPGARPGQ